MSTPRNIPEDDRIRVSVGTGIAHPLHSAEDRDFKDQLLAFDD
jgi:hypothetical protein